MRRTPVLQRLTAASLVALLAAAAPAQQRDYSAAAKAYADAMLQWGTDRWGRERSPQFASMLLRSDPPELLPEAKFRETGRGVDRMRVLNLPNIYRGDNRAHKVTYRGGDVAADAALYQLLYAISLATGDDRYAAAADASLRWFLAHAPFRNGLLPWGEHGGWDFRRERADYGFAFDNRHEFDSRWPLWERFFALQPEVGPGRWTAMERFSRGLWRGAVSEEGERLLYGRHAFVLGFARPADGEWKDFGMFPRHGGYYVGLWAEALARSENRHFVDWMQPRLERFVAALERQTSEHGFAVYLRKGSVVFNAPQVGSLAVDLAAAAKRLSARLPDLANGMDEVARRQDVAILRSGTPIHAVDSLLRADSNPDSKAAYMERFFSAADRWLDPVEPRELGRKVLEVTQAGRIPVQFAEAIDVLLLASKRTEGSRARAYAAAARLRAHEAAILLLTGDSALPRAIDRVAQLPDGSAFPEFYSSHLGGDDLMWSLWRLARTAGAGKTR